MNSSMELMYLPHWSQLREIGSAFVADDERREKNALVAGGRDALKQLHSLVVHRGIGMLLLILWG